MIEIRPARFDELDETCRAVAKHWYSIPLVIEIKPDEPNAPRT